MSVSKLFCAIVLCSGSMLGCSADGSKEFTSPAANSEQHVDEPDSALAASLPNERVAARSDGRSDGDTASAESGPCQHGGADAELIGQTGPVCDPNTIDGFFNAYDMPGAINHFRACTWSPTETKLPYFGVRLPNSLIEAVANAPGGRMTLRLGPGSAAGTTLLIRDLVGDESLPCSALSVVNFELDGADEKVGGTISLAIYDGDPDVHVAVDVSYLRSYVADGVPTQRSTYNTTALVRP